MNGFLGWSIAFLCAGGLLVGCGSSDETGDGNSRELSAEEFGKGWPLTVNSGTVRCEGSSVIFTAPDGTDYAVNGTAMTEYPEINAIWKDAPPSDPGPKISIGPVIDAGLELCD